VDNVYMINLERRPDRRTKMDTCLNELGIKYQWVKAVDGKKVFYHS
jgi:collagen beta-1,O-galactosyltransferase